MGEALSTDVQIEGQWGLYSIQPITWAGHAWVQRNLLDGERTYLAGQLMCEGGDRCRAIVVGMNRAGLAVTVNGCDMNGYGVP